MTLASTGIARTLRALCELMQFANEARHNTKCIKMTGYYPPVPPKYLVILGNDQLTALKAPSLRPLRFPYREFLNIPWRHNKRRKSRDLRSCPVRPLRICLHVEKEDHLYRAEIKLTYLAAAVSPADAPSEARNEIIEGM